MDNKRSVHKHCCLSPKNAHGSGRAVNLLHFTLLLNLTTAVLLQGNSAWMSVGVAQQSRGTEVWVYYTALVDDPLDSDQRIHILSVLPYHYWFFKKVLYTFPQPPFLPSGWLVHLNKNLSETRWLIIYCFEKGKSWIYTYPLNTGQLSLFYPSWIQWGEWVLWDCPAARENQENWMSPGTCTRHKWAKTARLSNEYIYELYHIKKKKNREAYSYRLRGWSWKAESHN